jgi:hypothetical protein
VSVCVPVRLAPSMAANTEVSSQQAVLLYLGLAAKKYADEGNMIQDSLRTMETPNQLGAQLWYAAASLLESCATNGNRFGDARPIQAPYNMVYAAAREAVDNCKPQFKENLFTAMRALDAYLFADANDTRSVQLRDPLPFTGIAVLSTLVTIQRRPDIKKTGVNAAVSVIKNPDMARLPEDVGMRVFRAFRSQMQALSNRPLQYEQFVNYYVRELTSPAARSKLSAKVKAARINTVVMAMLLGAYDGLEMKQRFAPTHGDVKYVVYLDEMPVQTTVDLDA